MQANVLVAQQKAMQAMAAAASLAADAEAQAVAAKADKGGGCLVM